MFPKHMCHLDPFDLQFPHVLIWLAFLTTVLVTEREETFWTFLNRCLWGTYPESGRGAASQWGNEIQPLEACYPEQVLIIQEWINGNSHDIPWYCIYYWNLVTASNYVTYFWLCFLRQYSICHALPRGALPWDCFPVLLALMHGDFRECWFLKGPRWWSAWGSV